MRLNFQTVRKGKGEIATMGKFRLIALIPPFFLDCVVAIGLLISTEDKKPEFKAVATGFLYGNFIEKVSDKESRYNVFLVTNRHAFTTLDPKMKTIYIRFNPEIATTPAKDYPLSVQNPEGGVDWFIHPCSDVDVAVIPMNTPLLRKEGMRFSYFQSDSHVADRVKANELGISEGDGIFVLGFPMGIIGNERNFTVVRQGSIARIRDFWAGSSKEFLADTFIFPGNSGGPVVTKPEILGIEGTKSIQSSYLIGMVTSFIPYHDTAISVQTKRPRITFEENSGLATIVPIDFVKETVREFLLPPKERKKGC